MPRALEDCPFYKRYPFTQPVNWMMADRRTVYDDRLNTFFVRINKSASTSVYMTMAAARDGKPMPELSVKRTFKTPAYMTDEQVRNFGSVFKFVFVRNPFARVLSCYLSMVESGKSAAARSVHTFPDFLRYLEDGHLYRDAHWAPQYTLLTLPLNEFDFIGRVEAFERDMNYVLDHIRTNTRRLVTAHTVEQTRADQLLRRYYDDKNVEIVQRLYRSGFEIFGYDPDQI